MKKLVKILLTAGLACLVATGAYADGLSKQINAESVSLISNLVTDDQKINISIDDVNRAKAGKDKVVYLGSFCIHANISEIDNPRSAIIIKALSNTSFLATYDGDINTRVPYTLRINNALLGDQNIVQGDNKVLVNLFATGNSCTTKETLYMNLPAEYVKNTKLGDYSIHLKLSSAIA